MFRKIISSLVALSIAFAPTAVSADAYMYRWKMDILPASVVDPTDPVDPSDDIPAGNDVDVYFAGPVGEPFQREVPIATGRAVRWQLDSGTMPSGITFADDSFVKGVPDRVQKTSSIFYGYNSAGLKMARARVTFTSFDGVGQEATINIYAHTGVYFYREIPSPAGVDVDRWEAIVANPAGTETRGSLVEGVPAKAGVYALAYRGLNYMGDEVAYAHGELVVEDGPVIQTIADQVADKNNLETFSVNPVIKRKLGPLAYTLVPVAARPSGLSFERSSGNVSGVFDDYDLSAKFYIQAEDVQDGTIGRSNVFTLTTTPGLIDLSNVKDMTGFVDEVFTRRFASTVRGVPLDWAVVQGQLPAGLSLDPSTGVISGTPTRVETKEGVVVSVSGQGVTPSQSNPFKITIRPPADPLMLTTQRFAVRVGKPFVTPAPVITSGDVPPLVFSTTTKSTELRIDPATGEFLSDSGISEPGDHDAVIKVESAAGRAAAEMQPIQAYEALALAYPPSGTAVKLTNFSARPAIPETGLYGPVKYEIVQGSLPRWLTFNTSNGLFTGRAIGSDAIGELGSFQVRLTDGFGDSILSNVFTLSLVDRDPVIVSLDTTEAQRYVVNQIRLASTKNAKGGADYKVVSGASALPRTLRISADGLLSGSTTDPVGTVYSGIVLRATDDQGYSADTPPFDITVVEPRLDPLDGNLAPSFIWTVNAPFDGLKVPRIGGTYGPTSYAVGPNPFGVTINDLALLGSANQIGQFEIPYTVDDDTARAPAEGTITLTVQPPMSISTDPVHFLVFDENGSVAPLRENGIAPFTYSISGANGLPDGMDFNDVSGRISGRPVEQGDFPLTITVRDRIGATAQAQFTIKVGPAEVFSFSFPDDMLVYNQSENSIVPVVANDVGTILWKVVSGRLPAGVRISNAEDSPGYLVGRPTESGIFPDVVISGTDQITGQVHTETVTVKVTKAGDPIFNDRDLMARRGAVTTVRLAADNVVAPFGFSMAETPSVEGFALDPATGVLSGVFHSAGDEAFKVKVVDLFDRAKTAVIKFTAVGDVALSMPGDIRFDKHVRAEHAPTVENLAGVATYALAAGSPALPEGLSLDPLTGVISGTPYDDGVVGGYRLSVLDGFDGQTAVSAPFSISVGARAPLTIAEADDIPLYLGHVTDRRLATENVFGNEVWALDAGSILPPGISFDAARGSFVGTPTKLGVYPGVTVTLKDDVNGRIASITRTFRLGVVQDGTPIILSIADVTGRVGHALSTDLPILDNAFGRITWSASGLSGTGLSLDPATGTISGTPTTAGLVTAVVTAADVTGRSVSEEVKLTVSPAVVVGMAAQTELVFNYAYATNGAQPTAAPVKGQAQWALTGPALPAGIAFDPSRGAFSGTPTALGEYGPYRLSVTDSLPGEALSQPFSFKVVMNGDPIALSVSGIVTKVGYPVATAAPTVGNVLGTPFFYSLDLAGTNLVVDSETGVITGSFQSVQNRNVNLSVSDDTTRITSKPVTIEVLPLMQVTAPASVSILQNEVMDPISVSRINVVGAATWDPVEAALLPPGVRFNATTGRFEGSPTLFGTFGPVTVTSRDSLGDVGTSNPITFTVRRNGVALELLAGALPHGVKRITPYEYDFKARLDIEGIQINQLAWSLAPGATAVPPGLSITNGVLSGTPTVEGTYSFDVTVGGGGLSSTMRYTLVVDLPEISLSLTTNEFTQSRGTAFSFDFKQLARVTNIEKTDLQWSVTGLSGATFSNGVITANLDDVAVPAGQTTVDIPFTVSAAFNSGNEHASTTRNYVLTVTTVEIPALYWRFMLKSVDNDNGQAGAYVRGMIFYDGSGVDVMTTPTRVNTTNTSGLYKAGGSVGNSLITKTTSVVLQLKTAFALHKFTMKNPNAQQSWPSTIEVQYSTNGTTWIPVKSGTFPDRNPDTVLTISW